MCIKLLYTHNSKFAGIPCERLHKFAVIPKYRYPWSTRPKWNTNCRCSCWTNCWCTRLRSTGDTIGYAESIYLYIFISKLNENKSWMLSRISGFGWSDRPMKSWFASVSGNLRQKMFTFTIDNTDILGRIASSGDIAALQRLVDMPNIFHQFVRKDGVPLIHVIRECPRYNDKFLYEHTFIKS